MARTGDDQLAGERHQLDGAKRLAADQEVADSRPGDSPLHCTRNPLLRLVFFVIGLMLRNIWLWIHEIQLAEGYGTRLVLHLEKLRFRRMLDWLAFQVLAELHDQSAPYVDLNT
jgi:hypothetical protein